MGASLGVDVGGSSPRRRSRLGDTENGSCGSNELVLMTLNLQYFASYPKGSEGEAAAREKLMNEIMKTEHPPDVICVQEGLKGRDCLKQVGFDLTVCAGQLGIAQSVYDMVYGDATTLANCDPETHHMMLCNQIYLRRDSSWVVADKGAEQISSNLMLVGGGGRAQGKLAIRSMVWAKLVRSGNDRGPGVYVMCTHLSGGRFEDQYFVQQLADERLHQPDNIMSFFEARRRPGDVGILLGDFNATKEYDFNGGAMHGYFKASIENSDGVKSDAAAASVQNNLEELFKEYMTSPFKSICNHGWTFAYDTEIGITSGFGHLIDHMAMSEKLKVLEARVIYFTNQKFGNKGKDTDLILTDHNSVKARFRIDPQQLDATPRPRGAGVGRLLLGVGLLSAVAYSYYSLTGSATYGLLSRATA
mmetsp:Transcript_92711/g.239420  ORF Transcript_92711/g.239420 Transcript_92711/m.239420 type:complete len:417 (-) Transcript_92711:154-1404(-)